MQPFLDRGYTGHEHMAGFGLINMNGRLYDPYLQRFLSPDPFIQAPGNAQNFNRYSYCLNNPLMYTDPSGYKLEYDWHLGEYRLDGEWVSHEFATAWMQMNGTTGSSWGGLGEFENSFFGKGGSWSFGITKTNNSWKWTSNADSNRKTGQILITISWSGVPLGTNPLTALMDGWLQGPRSGEPPIASSADRGLNSGGKPNPINQFQSKSISDQIVDWMVYIINNPHETIYYDQMVSSLLFESPIEKYHGLIKAHTENFEDSNFLFIINPTTINLNLAVRGIQIVPKMRRINIIQVPRFGNDSGLVLIYVKLSTNKAFNKILKKLGIKQ